MGRATSASWLSVALVFAAASALADKVYDTGQVIEGVLMNHNLDIPISTPETGTNTDTEIVYAIDGDHYIVRNEEGMQTGEGNDPDIVDKYSWSCDGGSVTQGAATTTWTSPAEGGLYNLTAEVNDKPKPLAEGESGDRDDAPQSITYRFPIDKAAAVQATGLDPVTEGTLEGTERHFNNDPVDGDRLYITDPDDPATDGMIGFFKRIEVRATIVPTLPAPRLYRRMFYWSQDHRGWQRHDGEHVQGSPYTVWTSDGPQADYCDRNPSDDPNNHIQTSDAPGLNTGGWLGPQDEADHTRTMVGLNDEGGHEFRDAVFYNGKRISLEWGDDALWTREVRIHSNPETGKRWVVDTNE